MRTRNEIEKDARECVERNRLDVLSVQSLEVLLDIRDLLSSPVCNLEISELGKELREYAARKNPTLPTET